MKLSIKKLITKFFTKIIMPVLKFSSLVAVVLGAYFTVGGIDLANQQLTEQQKSTKWHNYYLVNTRYANLMDKMPKSISESKKSDFNSLPEKEQSWVRLYFNLTSEEYWMHKEGLLPDEMWKDRIIKGVSFNLKRYPLLKSGFIHYRERSAFNHPKDFPDLIIDLINKEKIGK